MTQRNEVCTAPLALTRLPCALLGRFPATAAHGSRRVGRLAARLARVLALAHAPGRVTTWATDVAFVLSEDD